MRLSLSHLTCSSPSCHHLYIAHQVWLDIGYRCLALLRGAGPIVLSAMRSCIGYLALSGHARAPPPVRVVHWRAISSSVCRLALELRRSGQVGRIPHGGRRQGGRELGSWGDEPARRRRDPVRTISAASLGSHGGGQGRADPLPAAAGRSLPSFCRSSAGRVRILFGRRMRGPSHPRKPAGPGAIRMACGDSVLAAHAPFMRASRAAASPRPPPYGGARRCACIGAAAGRRTAS